MIKEVSPRKRETIVRTRTTPIRKLTMIEGVTAEEYRAVSEEVLGYMSGWIGLSNNGVARKVMIDLRDAVFQRAGQRMNQ